MLAFGLLLDPEQLSKDGGNSASAGARSRLAKATGGGPADEAWQDVDCEVFTPDALLDSSTLSHLEQELSSGGRKSLDTSQLLRSCGCDVDELLGGSSGSSSELSRRQAWLASGVLAPAPPTSTATRRIARPTAPAVPHSGNLRSSTRPSGGAPSSPPAAAAAATGGPGAPNEPIADEMLYRIERALSSGAMRPQQATQLLSSYGYDLEKLLEEELGAGPGPQARA
ncbi:hypothetical protein GPECTOR_41g738 [Gonium pectorale]|uniref:Uncharacterized protein n=1 Tax=Gonium pectorale TaxID=33097 RepID=A0A150GAH7_GONPE|nr:hypothetical protein GPECTOR_41g738 [Gonium pectorale]|eukprot:KXZ46773.1 hypothetical protein GPECTOR_41g738 [Gonium pectorale]